MSFCIKARAPFQRFKDGARPWPGPEITQALEDFRQAYVADPNDSTTLYEMALAKIKSGEWKDGLRWMKLAQDKGFQETGNFTDSIRAPAQADSAFDRLMVRMLGQKVD